MRRVKPKINFALQSKGIDMITNNIGRFVPQQQFFSRTKTSLASRLRPTERKNLSLQVLIRTELRSNG